MTALYDVTIRHSRTQRLERSFRHRGYLWLVDLDALPSMPRLLRPFARFQARDHAGDPAGTIRGNLDGWLATKGVELNGGRVLMLANARLLGYVFNPISVFWCYAPSGLLACVVAEVHNTYGERHRYLLHPDHAGRAEVEKDLYVSPFLQVEGTYRMSVPLPGETLAISVALHQHGRVAFSASVTGDRRPATAGALARMLLRHPLMPHRTTALIRRHGIALWLRGLPVTPRQQKTKERAR
ncbi:DUF1365 domain-containing protein [Pseudonocardia sp. TRM90224]|uniref:DUF1365 domain-containing protein n=1 Tax=Pseudonocardia sp. TRM90224 TaxID=2812678 RepID=UPI0027DEF0D8|nr:DUF1365 domain-containing protein [Pseudonocardia sp. TRM90224]